MIVESAQLETNADCDFVNVNFDEMGQFKNILGFLRTGGGPPGVLFYKKNIFTDWRRTARSIVLQKIFFYLFYFYFFKVYF